MTTYTYTITVNNRVISLTLDVYDREYAYEQFMGLITSDEFETIEKMGGSRAIRARRDA